MSIAVLLTINLKGGIGGAVKHTTKQVVTVNVTPIESKHPEFMTRKILHTDRQDLPCCRKIKFEEGVINSWANSDCPRWEKSSRWKTYSRQQKIESYLHNFDEGFGVSYEFV